MNTRLRLRQATIIFVSTAAGTGLGYGTLRVFGQAIVRYLPSAVRPPGPDKDGFGAMFALLMNIGYNLGLITGVLMTLAVIGGLVAGIALSRRVVPLGTGA